MNLMDSVINQLKNVNVINLICNQHVNLRIAFLGVQTEEFAKKVSAIAI